MKKNLIISLVLILLTLNLTGQDENNRNLSARFHFNPNVLFRFELDNSPAGAPAFDEFSAGGSYNIAGNIDLKIECISDYMFYLHYEGFKFRNWDHFNIGMNAEQWITKMTVILSEIRINQ